MDPVHPLQHRDVCLDDRHRAGLHAARAGRPQVGAGLDADLRALDALHAALDRGAPTEVRGEIPTTGALIASKHQSFLDSILLFSVLPAPRFIMKKQLAWIPLMGWMALQAGFIPVDRGKRGAAIKKMMADVEKGRATPGQLIIYPQGTRVAPGAHLPYKMGTAALYGQLEQPCYPVAANVGVFWPRHGIYRRPGTAVVEFLPPIQPGHTAAAFMVELETAIEDASNRLIAEARQG
uniref:Putative acetyl transferase n=1 Tax=Cereibacter sphaeroides TaxID=1063 RepID=Q9KX14_CERSP|nr:putative acetyl transferase [Cereibacter sphaeroides]